MKLFILLKACLVYLPVFSQFGIIADKDGFVNIRRSAEISDNIIETLNSGDVVYCFEAEGDWFPIDFQFGNQIKSGYVHQSRVQLIEQFKDVTNVNLTDTSASYRFDSLSVNITTYSFDPSQNELEYFRDSTSNSNFTYLEKINGRRIWGTDGNIPRMQYQRLTVQFGNEEIVLPTENLFEPDLENTFVHIDKNERTVYISALNSDGAGTYVVLWIVQDGMLKDRVTTIPF